MNVQRGQCYIEHRRHRQDPDRNHHWRRTLMHVKSAEGDDMLMTCYRGMTVVDDCHGEMDSADVRDRTGSLG